MAANSIDCALILLHFFSFLALPGPPLPQSRRKRMGCMSEPWTWRGCVHQGKHGHALTCPARACVVFACIIDLLVPQACKMGVPVGPVSQMRIAMPRGPVARCGEFLNQGPPDWALQGGVLGVLSLCLGCNPNPLPRLQRLGAPTLGRSPVTFPVGWPEPHWLLFCVLGTCQALSCL